MSHRHRRLNLTAVATKALPPSNDCELPALAQPDQTGRSSPRYIRATTHVTSVESDSGAGSPRSMTSEHALIILESYDLAAAERLLCLRALERAGSIVRAAKLLNITRHALKRRISKAPRSAA